MSIQKEFVLRYQIEGHVRFQIPAQICKATIAKIIEDGILAIEGVYCVNLYRRQQKLSIRFQESVCNFKSLARQLYQLLADLEKAGAFKQETVVQTGQFASWQEKTKARFNGFKATRWVKQKFSDAKETVQAAKIITKLGMKNPKAFANDPEKAMVDFFNDILVLFLIKLHWTHITQQWLLKPLKYRYEWMALFYMFYLLVRSRRKK
jgi:hypothetical protein